MRKLTNTLVILAATLLFGLATPAYADMFSQEEIAQTYELNQLDKPIKPIRQDKPLIPSELQGVKASVQIAFIIDEKGRVTNPRIVQCTNESFKPIVLENVSKWLFERGTKDGNPVSIRVVVPIRFSADRSK
jgi:TonB family protein